MSWNNTLSPAPEALLQQFEKLRKQLETATGSTWEVTLSRQRDKEIKLGDFNQRRGYHVSDVKQPYGDLEGFYPSIDAIWEKIHTLKKVDSFPGEKPDTWRCPVCSYGYNSFNLSYCIGLVKDGRKQHPCGAENPQIKLWEGISAFANVGYVYNSSYPTVGNEIARLSIL